MIYFDWNATTPLRREAKLAYNEAIEELWTNPSSAYRAGARTKLALEEARETVARYLTCDSEEIIFTSGATESNNAILREFCRNSESDAHIGIGATEHPAVSEAARYYLGDRVLYYGVDDQGRLDEEAFLKQVGKDKPAIISIMAANNETGVIQPWKFVFEQCQKLGIPYHTDASQWVGKLPLQKLGACDFVSFSGHKFGGPKGVGVLKVASAYRGIRVQLGGAQENDSRGGTENVPAILSMVAALKAVYEEPPQDITIAGRDHFQNLLKREWGSEFVIHGEYVDRLWNTVSLALPEFEAHRWVSQLDRLGFCVSTGAACSTGKAGPSATLAAMGVTPELSKRTIRISGGYDTPTEDWVSLADAMIQVRKDLKDGGSSNIIKID